MKFRNMGDIENRAHEFIYYLLESCRFARYIISARRSASNILATGNTGMKLYDPGNDDLSL